MDVLDLDAEVAESCLEMAIALSQAAHGRSDLLRIAWYVHRCYVRAVSPAPTDRTHELRWARFISALGAYLASCSFSASARKLRAIVDENADLLTRQTALASSRREREHCHGALD